MIMCILVFAIAIAMCTYLSSNVHMYVLLLVPFGGLGLLAPAAKDREE